MRKILPVPGVVEWCQPVTQVRQCIFQVTDGGRGELNSPAVFCTVATRFPIMRSCNAARAASRSVCVAIIHLQIMPGHNQPWFCYWSGSPLPPAGSRAVNQDSVAIAKY